MSQHKPIIQCTAVQRSEQVLCGGPQLIIGVGVEED